MVSKFCQSASRQLDVKTTLGTSLSNIASTPGVATNFDKAQSSVEWCLVDQPFGSQNTLTAGKNDPIEIDKTSTKLPDLTARSDGRLETCDSVQRLETIRTDNSIKPSDDTVRDGGTAGFMGASNYNICFHNTGCNNICNVNGTDTVCNTRRFPDKLVNLQTLNNYSLQFNDIVTVGKNTISLFDNPAKADIHDTKSCDVDLRYEAECRSSEFLTCVDCNLTYTSNNPVSDINADVTRKMSSVCVSLDAARGASNLRHAIPNVLQDGNDAVISKVNLDITALIALVSNLCHGACHMEFKDAVIAQQAVDERRQPMLPDLVDFLKNKELLVCDSAMRDFQSIIDKVGGALEKERTDALFKKVTTVTDDPSQMATSLISTSRINERAKIIFGTGDRLKAVTVTANHGFVRAASQAGVDFVVFFHPARALTEQKESTAVPL